MHVLYFYLIACLICFWLEAFLSEHVCLRAFVYMHVHVCAAASASMITCLAVISQIAEDLLAKAWPCHSHSLP